MAVRLPFGKILVVVVTITVPQGQEHRVTTRKPSENLVEPPQNPSQRSPQASEKQVSSESLGEGCAPRVVTLRNFISRDQSLILTPPLIGPTYFKTSVLWLVRPEKEELPNPENLLNP